MAKYLVQGVVYEGSGNSAKPLRSANVFSHSPYALKGTTTREDGSFQIELDTNEDTELTADKFGYYGVTKRVEKGNYPTTLVNFNLEKESTLPDTPQTNINIEKQVANQTNGETPKTSYLVGGLSGLALGTTTYLLSKKFIKSKWGQLGVVTASVVIFYFIGFNISNFVQNKQSNKTNSGGV